MIEDPLPRGDMPISIGIVEKAAPVDQQKQVDSDTQQEPDRKMAKTDGSLLIDAFDVCAHEVRF